MKPHRHHVLPIALLSASLYGCATPPQTQTTSQPATYTSPAMNVEICHERMARVAAYITTLSPAMEDCLRHKRGACGGLAMFVDRVGGSIPFDEVRDCANAGYLSRTDPALLLFMKEAPKFESRAKRISAMAKAVAL